MQPVVNYDHKTIQVRRGTTTEWRRYGAICIPAEGEICVEFFQNSDGTRNNNVGMKVGNGANSYKDLPYLITNQNMDDRISNDQIENWDEAYGWGDHSLVGYLTQELDPIFTSSPAATITVQDIANWNDTAADGITDEERQKLNEAHDWGNHAEEGYLTEELDPIFTHSPAAVITEQDIANWDEAASRPELWTEENDGSISRDGRVKVNGHLRANYIFTPLDTGSRDLVAISSGQVLSQKIDPDDAVYQGATEFNRLGVTSQVTAGGKAWFRDTVQAKDFLDAEGNSIINSNGITEEERQKLNEAHDWGDHSQEGYLTEELDPVFTSSPAATIKEEDIDRWNNPPSSGISEVAWADVKDKPVSINNLGTQNIITGGSY
jgi:hypothetical protein